jgi:hypothetical protein
VLALVAVYVKVAPDALPDTRRRVDLDYSLISIPGFRWGVQPACLKTRRGTALPRILRTNVLSFSKNAAKLWCQKQPDEHSRRSVQPARTR